MHEEINAILGESLQIGSIRIPVAHMRYRGSGTEFVTWTMLDEKPALSANDEDLYSVCSVDIDVFSKGNYLSIANYIKKIMIQNDWLWIGNSPEMYEEDTGLYHIAVSFEKERYTWQE